MSDVGTLAVGLLCPYDLDVPGGVREQVLGLGAALAARGHRVEVMGPRSGLAPEAPTVPGVVVRAAGGVVPLRSNGSTARLALWPAARVEAARWAAEGGFDVVHVHEPVPPGIGHAVLRRLSRLGPDRPAVAATVHVSLTPGPAGRSRALRGAARHVAGVLRDVDVLSAVSEHARRTVVDHLGRSPLVLPNGVDVTGWAATSRSGTPDAAGRPPTVVVVGRAGEPRKGVDVLLAAWPAVRRAVPDARLVVVGPSTGAPLGQEEPGVHHAGTVSEADKRRLVAGADVLVAPHRGGESFGLVLVEAMAVGTPVVASDLPAFRDVLAGTGTLVPPGRPAPLAEAVVGVLLQGAPGAVAAAGRRAADFDWVAVAAGWEQLYALAARLDGGSRAPQVLAEELARRARSVRSAGGRALDEAAGPVAAGAVRAVVEAAETALAETAAGRPDSPAALAAHNRVSALARHPSVPVDLQRATAVATARLHAVRLVVNGLARRDGRPLTELDDAPPPAVAAQARATEGAQGAPPDGSPGTRRATVLPPDRLSA